MQIINNIHKYLADGQAWYQRDVKTITVLTIHHTASLGENKTHEQILEEIRHEHVDVNGWPGISYHEVIMPDGTVYQLNDFTDVTWQDTHNFDSYSVCLVGYFHQPYNQQPTEAQLVSLRSRLDDLCNNHPEIPADASSVLGHRDRYATACPGDNLYPQVKAYRDNKGDVPWGGEAGVPPTQPPPPAPSNPNPSTPVDDTKLYTQAEMDAAMKDRATFWQERDTLQKQLDDANQQVHDLKNKLTPFTVSGYNTIDDVNKKIDQLTKDNADLYTENQKLLASNGVLAGQVEKVSTEDSKTAELGQGFIDENKNLKEQLQEIAKELETTDVKNIMPRIFELKDQAEQWLKILPQDEQNIIERVKTDGIKWFMQLLDLSKGKGGE